MLRFLSREVGEPEVVEINVGLAGALVEAWAEAPVTQVWPPS